MSSSSLKASNGINATFAFKKLMNNVASTTKLFGTGTDNNTLNESNLATKETKKDVTALEEEIEILKMQKEDLRKLVQERTYQLDQLQKLDTEHQKVRQRWKQYEEKAINDVTNIESYSEELKKELNELKAQNAMLQSKQTNNELIKNTLENQLQEKCQHEQQQKKVIDRLSQEKKMLVSEILKLRNAKQELMSKYKHETDQLNANNKHNIEQLTALHEQQTAAKEMEYKSQINGLQQRYDELDLLYTNYRRNISEKILNIDSTTKAFEVMINNSNIGNLSERECNNILDHIMDSIEKMEKENEVYTLNLCRKYGSEDSDDEEDMKGDTDSEIYVKRQEIVLHKIESRVLKTLREKALLQRSQNDLMSQLQHLHKKHDAELKAKDDVILKHELRAKVRFFKKRKQTAPK